MGLSDHRTRKPCLWDALSPSAQDATWANKFGHRFSQIGQRDHGEMMECYCGPTPPWMSMGRTWGRPARPTVLTPPPWDTRLCLHRQPGGGLDGVLSQNLAKWQPGIPQVCQVHHHQEEMRGIIRTEGGTATTMATAMDTAIDST